MDPTEPGRLPQLLMDVELFRIAGTTVTLASVVTFAIIVVVTVLASRLIQRAVVRALKMRNIEDEGTVRMTRRLVHWVVLGTGFAIGLETVGVSVTALFAAGAFLAVGLGFALQNITQNLASGLLLILERTIKPGDVLQVEGHMVRVVKIGIRATIVRTRFEEDLILPNSALVQNTVTNYTFGDPLYRLRVTVGVSYGSDLDEVRATLEEVARGLSWKHPEKVPVVLLANFGSSSVDYEVSVWMDDPWTARRHESEVREAIWAAFRRKGIAIAFPQLDLHLDRSVEETLGAARKG